MNTRSRDRQAECATDCGWTNPRSAKSALRRNLLVVLSLALFALCLAEESRAESVAQESGALALARQMVSICRDDFPDTKSIAFRLKSLGLKNVPGNAKLRGLIDPNRRVFVIAGQHRKFVGCSLIVRGMTPDEAVTLAQPWIKLISAAPGKPRRGNKVFDGAFAGRAAKVEIGEARNSVLSGLAISLGLDTRKKPKN